jgi:hypothetical protein
MTGLLEFGVVSLVVVVDGVGLVEILFIGRVSNNPLYPLEVPVAHLSKNRDDVFEVLFVYIKANCSKIKSKLSFDGCLLYFSIMEFSVEFPGVTD